MICQDRPRPFPQASLAKAIFRTFAYGNILLQQKYGALRSCKWHDRRIRHSGDHQRGFRFLKDPQFIASTLFVKKPERVEALLFIMTLCLSVYAAIEFKIRQALKQQDLTFPNQLKKQVNNPTARWIFACFTPVQVLYVNHRPQILNLNDLHRKVIGLLGNAYRKYYMLL